MTTHSQNNIFKPKQFHTTTKHLLFGSFKPSNPTTAFSDPNWPTIIVDKLNPLTRNGTWELVPPHPSQYVVDYKWVF